MYCLITSNGWPRSASIVINFFLRNIIAYHSMTNQSSGENNQKTRVKSNTTQQGRSDLITFSLDFNCQPPPTADLLFLACRRRLPIWRRDGGNMEMKHRGAGLGTEMGGNDKRRRVAYIMDGMESCGQLSSLLRGLYRMVLGSFVSRNTCRLFVGLFIML